MIWIGLFILLPLLDMTLLVHVAGVIGFSWTLVLVIATGMAGSALVRRQGVAVLRGIQKDLTEGRTPEKRIVSGLLLLVGGVLLITPGVITDVAGLLLMIPGNRRLLGEYLTKHLAKRIQSGSPHVVMFTNHPSNPDEFSDTQP